MGGQGLELSVIAEVGGKRAGHVADVKGLPAHSECVAQRHDRRVTSYPSIHRCGVPHCMPLASRKGPSDTCQQTEQAVSQRQSAASRVITLAEPMWSGARRCVVQE